MPTYKVEFLTVIGDRKRLEIEGDSPEKIKYLLEEQGNLVIAIKRYKFKEKNKSKKINIIIFVHELRTLLLSGLSLPEALDILIDHHQQGEDNPIAKIRIGLNQGLALSEAMKNASQEFPIILLATIAASERNGTLVKALESYIKYDEEPVKTSV